MKVLAVLFLAIYLSLSPSLSFCRDVTKYTIGHNTYILKNLNKDLYIFVDGLEKVEDDWADRKHIMLGMFGIIDKYNCKGKLYIVNRGLNIIITDEKISDLLITIFLMNSLGYLDVVMIKYNIDAVKRGDPVKIESDRMKT